ncbi:MAG: winged helix-turn-helix transcriptional regulator [Desulfobacteraceae bacterium]|nr:winged helix-turn-helix transcriptional regulator [Desulfobacteraceae bacterium]
MPDKKINDTKLIRLVDEGVPQVEIAEKLGVSRQAIHKRLRELRGQTTKVVAARKIEETVDRKIDSINQLAKINDHANWLLDHLVSWVQGDEVAIQVLEKNARLVNVGTKEGPEYTTEYKFKDPHELVLKTMAEIRGQLKLQLDIFTQLYSLQAAEEFQNTVLEVIGEISEDVRAEIIRRLNEKRSIRSALRFS